MSWDAAAYDAEAASTAAGPHGHDALPLAFRRDMIQQRRWQRQVDQMKMSNTVGILFVDSKKMRTSLQVRVGLQSWAGGRGGTAGARLPLSFIGSRRSGTAVAAMLRTRTLTCVCLLSGRLPCGVCLRVALTTRLHPTGIH